MSKYIINESKRFIRDLKRYKKSPFVIHQTKFVLELMRQNPFDPKLKSHSVGYEGGMKLYSSRVTGDLRIIWTISDNDKLIVILLKFGGHDDVY